MLVDVVSKNGNLLLNFPLKPDGTLDEEAEKIVKQIGSWMAVNGEAIYCTRPWKVFGEGPTRARGGYFAEGKVSYTPEDFRFTKKGDTLYAICMAWPESGQVTIRSLAQGSGAGRVNSVKLLGYDGRLK
ncbi:MAG TPA: hypothetical protein GXX55_11870 [Firmicutes bacterium]|nr:hypothetical protein [Bacillota bacterium]